jgi:hypothetical protein
MSTVATVPTQTRITQEHISNDTPPWPRATAAGRQMVRASTVLPRPRLSPYQRTPCWSSRGIKAINRIFTLRTQEELLAAEVEHYAKR